MRHWANISAEKLSLERYPEEAKMTTISPEDAIFFCTY